MKITFLLQSFPCLSETFILNQITGLIDAGCAVRILAFSKSADHKRHPDVLRYRLLDKTVFVQPPASKAACRFKAAVKILLGLVRHPVLMYRLQRSLLAHCRAYSYQKLFMALELIRQRPDIIHCHYGPMGQRAIFLKDIGLKTKISTVFHGYDLSAYLREHGPDAYRELFAKGDLFLPVSEFWKRTLIDLGCPAEKIMVHHMGIDLQKFTFRVRHHVDGTPFKVLTIGRLVEKKGHIYAIEAIARLLEAGINVHYEIIGDGPLRDKLEQTVDRRNIRANVVFRGAADQETCLAYLNSAHCLLVPSVASARGDMEGIPVVLMEAMASGLPVVSTKHSGIPELLQDRQNGFLVGEKDVGELADTLRWLISTYETNSVYTRNARNTVERHFEVRGLSAALMEFFETHTKEHS